MNKEIRKIVESEFEEIERLLIKNNINKANASNFVLGIKEERGKDRGIIFKYYLKRKDNY